MGRYLERNRQVLRAAATRFRRPAWWISAFGLIVLFLLQVFAGAQATAAWTWVRPHLYVLAGARIGWAGLALVGLLGALALLSFLETRPRPSRPIAIPISDSERRAVNDVRVAWKLTGRNASMALQAVLHDLVFNLTEEKSEYFWADLLLPILTRLDRAIRDMDEAVAMDSEATLNHVHERFDELYAAYYDAFLWLAKLAVRGRLGVTDNARFASQVGRFASVHRLFRYEAARLSQSPDHHASITMEPPVGFSFDREWVQFTASQLFQAEQFNDERAPADQGDAVQDDPK
jgi:hypothetical protein